MRPCTEVWRKLSTGSGHVNLLFSLHSSSNLGNTVKLSLAQCLGLPIFTLFIWTSTAEKYKKKQVSRAKGSNSPTWCICRVVFSLWKRVMNGPKQRPVRKVGTQAGIAEMMPVLLHLRRCEARSEHLCWTVSQPCKRSRNLLSPVFNSTKRVNRSSSEGFMASTFSGGESYKRG